MRIPVILCYHKINDSGRDALTVSVRDFRRQLQYLSRHRYRVISLKELNTLLEKGETSFHGTVVLTFDDGYRDNYVFAFPLLRKYRFPATVFLTTDCVEKGEKLFGEEVISWEEAAEMRDSGLIDFGSHTCSHPHLTRVPEERVEEELKRSRDTIETKLGVKAEFFCPPFGEFDRRVEKIARDCGYHRMVVTPGRRMSSSGGRVLLRAGIYRHNHMAGFLFKLKGRNLWLRFLCR